LRCGTRAQQSPVTLRFLVQPARPCALRALGLPWCLGDPDAQTTYLLAVTIL
jgi:hypothetical protein